MWSSKLSMQRAAECAHHLECCAIEDEVWRTSSASKCLTNELYIMLPSYACCARIVLDVLFEAFGSRLTFRGETTTRKLRRPHCTP